MWNFLVKTPPMTLPQSPNQLVTMMSHWGAQIFAIVNVGLQVCCKLFFIPIFSLIYHKYMWLNPKMWIQLWCRDGFDNHNWVTSKFPSTFIIYFIEFFCVLHFTDFITFFLVSTTQRVCNPPTTSTTTTTTTTTTSTTTSTTTTTTTRYGFHNITEFTVSISCM